VLLTLNFENLHENEVHKRHHNLIINQQNLPHVYEYTKLYGYVTIIVLQERLAYRRG
jgi:hypothetical protein